MRIKVPNEMRENALLARRLKYNGFSGGTMTAMMRMEQLIQDTHIDLDDLRAIRNWLARHIHSSYPSYLRWTMNGRPMTDEYKKLGGIFSWLAWGGDAAIDLVNKYNDVLNETFDTYYVKLKI